MAQWGIQQNTGEAEYILYCHYKQRNTLAVDHPGYRRIMPQDIKILERAVAKGYMPAMVELAICIRNQEETGLVVSGVSPARRLAATVQDKGTIADKIVLADQYYHGCRGKDEKAITILKAVKNSKHATRREKGEAYHLLYTLTGAWKYESAAMACGYPVVRQVAVQAEPVTPVRIGFRAETASPQTTPLPSTRTSEESSGRYVILAPSLTGRASAARSAWMEPHEASASTGIYETIPGDNEGAYQEPAYALVSATVSRGGVGPKSVAK